MKTFDCIFYWVSKLIKTLNEGGVSDDKIFNTFLDNGNGYLWGFLIAVIFAFAACAAYYLVIGRLSFKFSKKYVWCIFLVVFGLATFFTNASITKSGLDKVQKEIFKKKSDQWGEIKQNSGEEAFLEQKADDENWNNVWKKTIKRGIKYTPIRLFSIMSMIYQMLFFFGLSFLFKGFSIHAKAIPFGGKPKDRKTNSR